MAGRAATRRPKSDSPDGEQELETLNISSDEESVAFADSTNNQQVLLRPCLLQQCLECVQLCDNYAYASILER